MVRRSSLIPNGTFKSISQKESNLMKHNIITAESVKHLYLSDKNIIFA